MACTCSQAGSPSPAAAIHEAGRRVLPEVSPAEPRSREASFESWTHVGLALSAGLCELPRSLSVGIKRMLSAEPEQRYASLARPGRWGGPPRIDRLALTENQCASQAPLPCPSVSQRVPAGCPEAAP